MTENIEWRNRTNARPRCCPAWGTAWQQRQRHARRQQQQQAPLRRATVQDSQQPFIFLNLPAELRIMIYYYYAGDGQPLVHLHPLGNAALNERLSQSRRFHKSALAYTCSQVFREYYYEQLRLGHRIIPAFYLQTVDRKGDLVIPQAWLAYRQSGESMKVLRLHIDLSDVARAVAQSVGMKKGRTEHVQLHRAQRAAYIRNITLVTQIARVFVRAKQVSEVQIGISAPSMPDERDREHRALIERQWARRPLRTKRTITIEGLSGVCAKELGLAAFAAWEGYDCIHGLSKLLPAFRVLEDLSRRDPDLDQTDMFASLNRKLHPPVPIQDMILRPRMREVVRAQKQRAKEVAEFAAAWAKEVMEDKVRREDKKQRLSVATRDAIAQPRGSSRGCCSM